MIKCRIIPCASKRTYSGFLGMWSGGIGYKVQVKTGNKITINLKPYKTIIYFSEYETAKKYLNNKLKGYKNESL